MANLKIEALHRSTTIKRAKLDYHGQFVVFGRFNRRSIAIVSSRKLSGLDFQNVIVVRRRKPPIYSAAYMRGINPNKDILDPLSRGMFLPTASEDSLSGLFEVYRVVEQYR